MGLPDQLRNPAGGGVVLANIPYRQEEDGGRGRPAGAPAEPLSDPDESLESARPEEPTRSFRGCVPERLTTRPAEQV